MVDEYHGCPIVQGMCTVDEDNPKDEELNDNSDLVIS
jgi:hypothetical protein